ncbi:MAG: hypothetical protein NUV54_00065, partial [Candidatus Taylorbacteria bacterium]|nr:hypothetical protein [Candidatus Taylorbacteria bacterium]
MLKTAIVGVALVALFFVTAVTPTIEVFPELSVFPVEVEQGEPIRIIVGHVAFSEVQDISVDGVTLGVVSFNQNVGALAGIGIHGKVGVHHVSATLAGGRKLGKTFIVRVRPKEEAPLGIPQKLGGNTTKASNALVRNLEK